ncbi:sodium/solute symporter [candidate division KSB1 bacterium]|nr:sodium/solute symporter [candidate division KSB1 bacterium]
MDIKFNLSTVDLLTIIIFLAFMVALGCWIGWIQRKSTKGSDYFLASRSLIWPWIGLSLFASNISAIELVGCAEEGFKRGLLYGNLEFMAGVTLIILAIFFAPFYIRSKVATLPDFLLKRYNNKCRIFEVGMAIFTAIFIHCGFALFAGAKVIQGLFNIPMMISMTIILMLTGLYTIVGGLRGVVLTDSFAAIVLIGGSIVMTIIGFNMIGGWEGLTASVEPVRFHMLRSDLPARDLSWYAVFLGYPVIGIWYFCTDQTISQRVLGAKNENHARTGALFAGFIKVLPVFIFVLPGLILFGLLQSNSGSLPPFPLKADGTQDTALAYAYMIANVLPVGVKGLVTAAMLAALMSTLSSVFNSVATVFCYDIYKPIWPKASEKDLIKVGRRVTIATVILSIAWASQIGKFGTVLEVNTTMICYICPAVTAVFLGGVLWKGASGKGAFITLCIGTFMGLIIFVADVWSDFWSQLPGFGSVFSFLWRDWSFMMVGFWLFIVSCVILYITSRHYPHKHTAESEKLVWESPLAALRRPGWSGFGNYKFLSVLLLGILALCYVLLQLVK